MVQPDTCLNCVPSYRPGLVTGLISPLQPYHYYVTPLHSIITLLVMVFTSHKHNQWESNVCTVNLLPGVQFDLSTCNRCECLNVLTYHCSPGSEGEGNISRDVMFITIQEICMFYYLQIEFSVTMDDDTTIQHGCSCCT